MTSACTPPSGINFPIGTTPVTCTATDAKQKAASCSFEVTVNPAPIPQIGLTRFAAFGDSITLGQDGQDDPNATPLDTRIKPLVIVNFPYPARLRQYLDARYTKQSGQFIVDNEGCQGEAAGGTGSPCWAGDPVARFGQGVIQRGARNGSGSYAAVLIMEGSNDVGLAVSDFSAEIRAIAALQSMIDYAKLFNVRPYLATIPPQNPAGTPSRVKGALVVPEFNSRLLGLAQAEGIPLVDVYNSISLSDLAPDGLHLRQAGYDKVAQAFLDKLATTAEVPVTTTSITTTRPTVRRVR